MKLDRALQRKILEALREAYPGQDRDRLFANTENDEDLQDQIAANLIYLEEHGLVDSGTTLSITGTVIYQGARIKAAGLDFIEDDGGLTSILGTVTVKLHADTIRDLMLAKIDESPLPGAEKSVMKKAISTLSAEALKEITKRLVTLGLDRAPDAVALLKTLIPAG